MLLGIFNLGIDSANFFFLYYDSTKNSFLVLLNVFKWSEKEDSIVGFSIYKPVMINT